MLSGKFWRRAVVAAGTVMAGSALGAGVPSLISHHPHNTAQAATTSITLQVPSLGIDDTFTKFGGITDDVTVGQPCGTNCKPTVTPTPPTITLRDPFAVGIATYKDMFNWMKATRAGDPTAQALATLTLTNTTTGTTIAQYALENAYPTNVDVPAGDPQAQSTAFTVTLTGDNLVLVSP
jgi:hypothetical protein